MAQVGMLMLDTRFPRPPGDVGHPATWPFEVLTEIVPGASPARVVRQGDPALLGPFVEAGQRLVARGARGITTSCGFLVLHQQALAAALPVPVLTSALMQVELVNRLLPQGRRAGILTIAASSLGPAHLAAAGVPAGTPIGTTEGGREFTRAILGNEPALNVAAARADLVEAACALRAAHPDLGAIVLECTNMGPYAADITRATGLPVWSMVSLLRWFQAGLAPPAF